MKKKLSANRNSIILRLVGFELITPILVKRLIN